MVRDLAPVYVTYLVVVVALTAWLAVTLHGNGVVFLRDVFPDRPDLAAAVNRLLVTGFALVNLGYGLLTLDTGDQIAAGDAGGTAMLVEVLARKLGILLLSLAAIHFVNLLVFHKLAEQRRRRLQVAAWSAGPWGGAAGAGGTVDRRPPPPEAFTATGPRPTSP